MKKMILLTFILSIQLIVGCLRCGNGNSDIEDIIRIEGFVEKNSDTILTSSIWSFRIFFSFRGDLVGANKISAMSLHACSPFPFTTNYMNKVKKMEIIATSDYLPNFAKGDTISDLFFISNVYQLSDTLILDSISKANLFPQPIEAFDESEEVCFYLSNDHTKLPMQKGQFQFKLIGILEDESEISLESPLIIVK